MGERGQSYTVGHFAVENYSERDRRDLKTTLTSCHVSDKTHCSSETGVLYFLDDLGVIMYDSFRDASRHNSIHVRLTSCSNDAVVCGKNKAEWKAGGRQERFSIPNFYCLLLILHN